MAFVIILTNSGLIKMKGSQHEREREVVYLHMQVSEVHRQAELEDDNWMSVGEKNLQKERKFSMCM